MTSKKWTEDSASVVSRNVNHAEQSTTAIMMGKTAVYTERDWNELQEMQNFMRQEIVRGMVHSGVLDHNSTIAVGLHQSDDVNKGQVKVTSSGQFSNTVEGHNAFQLNSFRAVINGLTLSIKKNEYGASAGDVNLIKLPAPPTYGTRDDLVFLEMWYEEVPYATKLKKYGGEASGDLTTFEDTRATALNKDQSSRIQAKWRIRTEAGVDFNLRPKGFRVSGEPWIPLKVSAQGGHTVPYDNETTYGFYFNSVTNQNDLNSYYGKFPVGDSGLFIAGDGSQFFKDKFKTVDGYVYAIPLFRVKRRNSGGYRTDNLNGARDFYKLSGSYTTSPTSPNNITTVTLSQNDYDLVRVGDKLSNSSQYSWQVVSKNSATDVTLKNIGTSDVGTLNAGYPLVSDRPDGLYSNIIDKRDLEGGDLRHRVSLIGENFDKLLQESFDKYMRTELRPKSEETVKNRYGLKRAPLGLKQELVPVKLKGADNVDRELINLLEIGGQAIVGKNYLAYSPSTKHGVSLDGTYTYGTTKFQGAKSVGAVLMADFVGKVSGSTVENPHIARRGFSTTLVTNLSGAFGEDTTSEYTTIQTLNGTNHRNVTSTNGEIAQHLFSFNLIRHIEDNYGTIPKTTVADKVQWLKDNLKGLFCNWFGFGSSVGGNKSTLVRWNVLSSVWESPSSDLSGIVSKMIDGTITPSSNIDANGFVHYLAYAEPSDGVTPSIINTDYVYLEVELKPTANLKSTKGTIVYEISQSDYDKVNVDAEFTGDKLLTKFPYVDNYPNFVENIFKPTVGSITGQGITATVNDLGDIEVKGTATSSTHIKLTGALAVTNTSSTWNGEKYTSLNNVPLAVSIQLIKGSSTHIDHHFILRKVDGSAILDKPIRDFPQIVSSPQSEIGNIGLWFNTGQSVDFTMRVQITPYSLLYPFVPFGRWYLPTDYANSKTLTKIGEQFNSARRTLSDAQTSESVTMVVDPASPKADKHVTVAQATAGAWTANDTIKIKSDYGVVSGVIDSDTALAKIVVSDGTNTMTLDNASKLVVGDTVALYSPSVPTAVWNAGVTAIDGNRVTFVNSLSSTYIGSYLVETTTSSSSPVTSATGLAGTWTGLGTKEATFTITTAPTTNTEEIEFKYSVNYPAGKGIEYLPSEVLEANVNGQKLVKGTTVSVKANYEGKVSGNTDLNPHTYKRVGSATLVSPSTFTSENDATAYTQVSTLNGVVRSYGVTVNTSIAQELFSINVIRAIEDKYGEIPAKGVAGKVQWIKDNMTKLTASWWGTGSNAHANPIQKDDFTGKVPASTVENPHIYKNSITSTVLISPTGGTEVSNPASYPLITSINGTVSNATASASGQYAQQLFSFNLLEAVQRKYGSAVPGATTADKVQWLKDNIVKITANWHGFGSSVGGNKATFTVWDDIGKVWSSNTVINSSGTIGKLVKATGAINVITDVNGFVHFLAYAEPSDGVTASTINTDYIDIEIELKSVTKASLNVWNRGSMLWSPIGTNTSSSVSKLSWGADSGWVTGTSSDGKGTKIMDENGFVHYLANAEPSNGVAPSTIQTDYFEVEIELNVAETGYTVMQPENPFPVLSPNLLNYSLATPVDLSYVNNRGNSSLAVEEVGVIKVVTSGNVVGEGIEVFAQTNIPAGIYHYSASVKGSGVVDVVGIGVGVTSNTGTTATLKEDYTRITGKFTVSSGATSVGFRVHTSQQIGQSPQAVTYYIKDLTFKAIGVDSSVWSEGLKKKVVLNYLGKVEGSKVENPHRVGRRSTTLLPNPTTAEWGATGVLEATQTMYEQMSKLDGVVRSETTSTVGSYMQHLYEFDLSHLGLSLKELKSALRKLTVTWTGYGKGDNSGVQTYGSKGKVWDDILSSWVDSSFGVVSGSSPSTATANWNSPSFISKNQKVYLLVHSQYPASATIPSEIFTDYIKLEVELADYVDYVKGNIVKVRPETKEAKLHFPAKSNRYVGQGANEDVVELHYKHIPVADKVPNDSVTILSEIPEFFLSDLSTSVGQKQGTHQYMNPLYRLSSDRVECFGDFGFADTDFSADSKGVNIGAKVTLANPYGLTNNYTSQYGLPVIKKPLVGTARYLVMHNNELKLMLISRYSSVGDLRIGGTTTDITALLIPIEGRPLVRQPEGIIRASITQPTAWKTPTGEIQGYLREDGTVVATYQ